MADPPYGVILKGLKTGRVVPFLGAGASLVGRPETSAWSQNNPAFLPSGSELAEFLAEESEYPSKDQSDRRDLAKVSSYYGDVAGRPTLRGSLRDVFLHDVRPGPLHTMLAEIDRPLLIIVTNYDRLLEQSFAAAKKPYDLVIHPTDRTDYAGSVLWWPHGESQPQAVPPSELDIDLEHTTVIYKMHGSVDESDGGRDSFVITEEDYVDFLSRMIANQAIPAMFYTHCRTRSFLFLGYGLRDWNLRVILKNLNRAFSRQANLDDNNRLPSWAIQREPTEVERLLWKERNVNIFDMDLDTFVAKMRSLMEHPR